MSDKRSRNISNLPIAIPDVPDAPVIGTATDVGTSRAYNNGAATVAFSQGTGGLPTSYSITSDPGNFSVSGSTSPLTITGLQSGVAYTFKGTATNAVTTSPLSTISSNSITATTVPDVPTAVSGSNVGSGRAYNNGRADISFSAPATGGKSITSYTVTSTPGNLTGTGSASPISVTGLTSATSYTYTVTATNANGTGLASSASGAVTATTVPQAPTIGTFTDGGTGTSGTLSFTANATGGSAITNYKVSTDNVTFTALSPAQTSSPLSLSGLSTGTATYYIKAVNANGDSAASSGVAGTVIFPSNFESIATVTLGADGTVTFSSIPSTYKALQIRWIARDVTSGNSLTYLTYKINGSTTGYASHYLEGNGSAVTASGTTSSAYADYCGEMFFDTGNPVYGVGIMDIIDYASTSKTKTIRVFGGADRNGQGGVRLSSNLWNNTSAITSITFSSAYVNLKAGSSFALYGIK